MRLSLSPFHRLGLNKINGVNFPIGDETPARSGKGLGLTYTKDLELRWAALLRAQADFKNRRHRTASILIQKAEEIVANKDANGLTVLPEALRAAEKRAEAQRRRADKAAKAKAAKAEAAKARAARPKSAAKGRKTKDKQTAAAGADAGSPTGASDRADFACAPAATSARPVGPSGVAAAGGSVSAGGAAAVTPPRAAAASPAVSPVAPWGAVSALWCEGATVAVRAGAALAADPSRLSQISGHEARGELNPGRSARGGRRRPGSPPRGLASARPAV